MGGGRYMYIGVKNVKPLKDYKLELEFENGEKKIFDIKPYLNTGKIAELMDENLFKQVRISFDAIEWPNGLDLDPEFLYKNSEKLEKLEVINE